MYQPGNFTPYPNQGQPTGHPTGQPFPGQPYQPNMGYANQPTMGYANPHNYQPNPYPSGHAAQPANQAYVNAYYAQMMEAQRLLNIKLAQEREYASRQPAGPKAPVDPGGNIRKYDHVLYVKAGDPACEEAIRLCKCLDNVFTAFLEKIPVIPPCVTRVPTIVDSIKRLVYPPHLCGRYIQELYFHATNYNHHAPQGNINARPMMPRVTSSFRDPNSATSVISGCDIASTHDPRCKPPSAGAFNLHGAYPNLRKMATLHGSADYTALLAMSDRLIKEAKEKAQLMQDRPPEAVSDTATPQEQALIEKQMADHLERIKQNVKTNNTPNNPTTTA